MSDIGRGDDQDVFPQRLRQAREARGLSQTALAAASGLPQSSIAHFESTGGRKPSFENLRRLANALNVTTDYLIGRSERMEDVQEADPLYRHVSNLTASDRHLASEFLQMLAARSKPTRSDG